MRTAVILGAGPAGLTAAWELLQRTEYVPLVLEAESTVGGLARTVEQAGRRLDIGGHRFFTQSENVLAWWFSFLPLQRLGQDAVPLRYHGRVLHLQSRYPTADPDAEAVFLVRPRKSRIFAFGHLFEYPLLMNAAALRHLGIARSAAIGTAYLWRRFFPRRSEKNLEDFLVNRFGDALYRYFFKDYTEKVWGVPCTALSAEWGAQRIRGVSLGAALRQSLPWRNAQTNDTPPSLTEYFLYPRRGPGQLWERVAQRIIERGGSILLNHRVTRLRTEGKRVVAVYARDTRERKDHEFSADLVFSTVPIADLCRALGDVVPNPVRAIACALPYRDFVTVGLEVSRVHDPYTHELLPDNWIYIQDPRLRVGRLQVYNNWSTGMAPPSGAVWLGLEYFCNRDDPLYNQSDEAWIRLAHAELHTAGFCPDKTPRFGFVVRVEKAYPAYHGAYREFSRLRTFFDDWENLFLIGRNGMHRYNNQDHAMLTAMAAVDVAAGYGEGRDAIWAVNTGEEYIEAAAE